MFSGMVLLKRVVTAIVQAIDPAVAGFEQFAIWRNQEKPNPSRSRKEWDAVSQQFNENADD